MSSSGGGGGGGGAKRRKTVAIIGTAGRGDDGKKMTTELYFKMAQYAQHVIQEKWGLDSRDVHLVSGGSAWADSIAVYLFVERSQTDNGREAGPPFGGITLYLPCAFNRSTHTFADNGNSDWKSNPGRTLNRYHREMEAKTGIPSLQAMGTLWAFGGKLDETSRGFAARNRKVAQSDYVLAFTWGAGTCPKDGGTKQTWDMTRIGAIKHHVPLGELASAPAVEVRKRKIDDGEVEEEVAAAIDLATPTVGEIAQSVAEAVVMLPVEVADLIASHAGREVPRDVWFPIWEKCAFAGVSRENVTVLNVPVSKTLSWSPGTVITSLHPRKGYCIAVGYDSPANMQFVSWWSEFPDRATTESRKDCLQLNERFQSVQRHKKPKKKTHQQTTTTSSAEGEAEITPEQRRLIASKKKAAQAKLLALQQQQQQTTPSSSSSSSISNSSSCP